MKICPNCGDEHSKKGTFCSRKCANKRIWSKSTNTKRRQSIKRTRDAWTQEQRDKVSEVSRRNQIERWTKYRQDTSTEEMKDRHTRRRKVIEEQNAACLTCKLSEWNGLPLVLEVDHIDGNKSNNARDNLRALCPNCHSQTPTWRGRGRGRGRGRARNGPLV